MDISPIHTAKLFTLFLCDLPIIVDCFYCYGKRRPLEDSVFLLFSSALESGLAVLSSKRIFLQSIQIHLFAQMYHLQSNQRALATHLSELHPNDEEFPTENVLWALQTLK